MLILKIQPILNLEIRALATHRCIPFYLAFSNSQAQTSPRSPIPVANLHPRNRNTILRLKAIIPTLFPQRHLRPAVRSTFAFLTFTDTLRRPTHALRLVSPLPAPRSGMHLEILLRERSPSTQEPPGRGATRLWSLGGDGVGVAMLQAGSGITNGVSHLAVHALLLVSALCAPAWASRPKAPGRGIFPGAAPRVAPGPWCTGRVSPSRPAGRKRVPVLRRFSIL